MGAKKELTLDQALAKIQGDLTTAAGYPTNTTEDHNLAFAYGLVVGAVMWLRNEWQEKLK